MLLLGTTVGVRVVDAGQGGAHPRQKPPPLQLTPLQLVPDASAGFPLRMECLLMSISYGDNVPFLSLAVGQRRADS